MTRTTYADVERLVTLARCGDVAVARNARRLLMEVHVGMAFVAAKGYKDDESLAEALAELVFAVNDFVASGEDAKSLPAYLKVALRRAAFRHKRVNEREIVRVSKTLVGLCTQRALVTKHVPKIGMVRSIQRLAVFGPKTAHIESVDAKDYIASLCETVQEERVIELKRRGYTNTEIASALSLSKQAVTRVLQAMRLRHLVQVKLGRVS